MKVLITQLHWLRVASFFLLFFSCKNHQPSIKNIEEIRLNRGAVILSGPPDHQFGKIDFKISGSSQNKKDFNLAIALLHSFEYEEAEKVFAKIIDEEPSCAMAYWGVAMSNYHPLWAPPAQAELEKGSKAILIAQSINNKTEKESAYINAIALFYKDADKTDHHTRSVLFEKAMEKAYNIFSDDKEIAVFYALSLNAAAEPTDTTFVKQKKAGAILNALYPGEPNHPGVVHYLIHTYDYPSLAIMALPAARKYASIAPSSAHAQHMPSHIFTRLGLWDECITSNLVSTSSAKCYAESAGIKGHWDEELHAMDYLMYAYLQNGNDNLAKEQYDYLKTIKEVFPVNFKVAYAFAAIPARYFLENKMWKAAAEMEIYPEQFPWQKFPWQKAIIHFTRLLGAVHSNKLNNAKAELKNLHIIYDTLVNQKDLYKANQVQIQIKMATAWILFKEGKNQEALKWMNDAVEMEDRTGKHPVTPGEIIPARESLADMLFRMNKYENALEAYEKNLQIHPNRFNGLYGAGLAAEKCGNNKKANIYFQLLVKNTASYSKRTELKKANEFLQNKK